MKFTFNTDLHKQIKIIVYLFLFTLAVAIFLSGGLSVLERFSVDQQLTLGLLVFAVYLWIAAPIPTGASSFLILALMLLLNLVDTVEEVLAGFLSPAIYFILLLSIISHVLVKVGLDQVVSRFLIRCSKGGIRFIIIGLPLFVLISPIILPSAVARFKILFPLIQNMNYLYGFAEKSIFQKYSLYIIGMLNQNVTTVIFTGGGFPILASQLIRDYNIADLGWVEWFIMIAPPLWLGSIFMVLFVWYYLKMTMPDEKITTFLNKEKDINEERGEVFSTKFWFVLVSFFLMIIVWIVTDQEKVPLLLPPMLLVAFYAIPKIRLVTNRMLRDYDWENFLLLGASFSLGLLLESNGTAEALANLLIGFIPEGTSIVIKVVIIAFIVFVLRFFFIVPSSAIIVIFPIVISYSELIGIPPIQLAFLVVMIIGGMMILPIHTTTTYLAYGTGIFSRREQYVFGMLTSILFVIIAILSVFFYW